MTILYGHLQDVTGQPFDQQGTAVVISATQARPAMHSDALTLVELARIPMEDSGGHFETAELDPGPVIVMLEGGVSHGQQWEIGIPDDGERWNLADLIGEQVEWEPDVTSRAEAAARESRQYAEQAEALYGDLDAVSTARDESVAAAAAADVSQKAAATSETNADGHEERARAEADRATEQASAAAGSADTAVVAQGKAAASADHAAERADWSEKCAGISREYNDTAWTARGDALDARDRATAAATTAEGAAATATTEADRAQVAADSVDTDVIRQEVTDQIASVVDGAPDDLDTIREVAEYAQANLGITDTLNAAIGQKADKAHTHTILQVDGLQPALADKADTASMNARPALFSGEGTAPSTISGAVVGDWWLNTTTMELSKITGV